MRSHTHRCKRAYRGRRRITRRMTQGLMTLVGVALGIERKVLQDQADRVGLLRVEPVDDRLERNVGLAAVRALEVAEVDDKIIVATYGVAAVGINIPRIFNLVLVEPGKSFVRVIQSIGRGIRKAEDKDFVQIWDITSTCKFAKRHLTKRKQFYKEANYPFTIEKASWQ